MHVEENWNMPVLWQAVTFTCHPNDLLQPCDNLNDVNLWIIDVATPISNFEDYLRWVSKWIIFGWKYELWGRLECASALVD